MEANGDAADAQRRLLDAQASLDRDYGRLRELETRYRYLLNSASDAILLFDAAHRRIFEVNPAACHRLASSAAALIGSPVTSIVGPGGDLVLTRKLDALIAGADAAAFPLVLADGNSVMATASLFRQDGAPVFMLYLDVPAGRSRSQARETAADRGFADYFAKSPDATVLTDRSGKIVQANSAFLELVQVATERQVRGASLGRWLGRTSVDLGVLVTNLRQRGSIKLFATHLRAEHGALSEVEISAVAIGDDGLLGFAMRDVGRRLSAVHGARDDLPKSVAQLTELVGRLPMKDIVGNTTGLIEQMCIRAALELTRDNRAAAAELLGLSRQSLYVKLRRYEMLDSDGEDTE
ncbi:MAG: transcriptional regulator PpsR [Burkholderiaceae bacterium]